MQQNKLKKLKWYHSLSFTIALFFIPVAIVPLVVLSYSNYQKSSETLIQTTNHDLEQNSLLEKKFIQNWFHYRETDITNWASSSAVIDFMMGLKDVVQSSKMQLKEFIKTDEYFNITVDMEGDLVRIEQDYDYIDDLYLIDTQGNMLYTNEHDDDLGASLSDGIYAATKFAKAFRKSKKTGKVHFSDLEYYPISNDKVTGFFIAPIVDYNGNLIGYLGVKLELTKIYKLINSKKMRTEHRDYIVGEDGLLRSKIDEKTEILRFKVDTEQFKLWRHDLEKADADVLEHVIIYKDAFGKDVFGIHQDLTILDTKWELISEIDVAQIQNMQNEILYKTLISLIIIFLILIFVSVALSRYIANPIRHLSEAVESFSDGERDVDFEIKSDNEIGLLSRKFLEMTERISKSETELDEQKLALNAHAIVAITDCAGVITYANSKFVDISGYSKEELIGENHRIINSGAKPKSYWREMYETISSGEIWHDEVKNRAKDGSYYWADTTIVPFIGEDGKPKSYISIRSDITEKKKDELALIEAKKISDESVKVKSEFFASMSHEIRTPMNGIIGMLGLLLKTELSKTQQHQAYLAQTSAKALLSLINDILDFSKFDAEKLELDARAFDIRTDFGDFAEAIAIKAQEKSVEVILDMKDVDVNLIVADSHRLLQILNNLVSNSIKFTSKGYILIDVDLVKQSEEKARLKIQVSDTGIGIPQDKLSKLFDSFSQVDSSTTRKYGGTGLGLAIVKKLTEIMDGDVSVVSKEGEGSIFSVDVAVELCAKSKKVLPEVEVVGKKVLIIDECDKSAEVLAAQLECWGMKASTEDSGDFDIAYIDKSENALSLAKELRAKQSGIKLVLMTSFAQTVDVEKFIDGYFDTYFPKPVTTNDILHSLRLFDEDGRNESLDELQNEETLNSFDIDTKILLVDDNKVNQLVALGILEEFGLEADVANNGLEAISIVEKSSEPYKIIFMDCQMPEMDGYEATRILKSGECGEGIDSIPIVAMTANAMEGDKEKCFASGMNDYISKPIDPERLEEILKRYLL